MADKNWLKATTFIYARAKDGFKLSEMHGLRLAAANKLIDRGKLHAMPLPNGDFLVTKL